MVYRVLGGLMFSLVSWLFMIWAGVFGGSSFDTNFFGDGELVERPVAEVYAALDAVDMDSGGELEVLETTPRIGKLTTPQQSISWTVYSGEHPALTMAATLKPARDGAATVVNMETTRHDLPRGVTAPASRVPGAMELVMRMAVAQALAPMDSEYATELNRGRAELERQAVMPGPATIFRAHAELAAIKDDDPSKEEWAAENDKRYRAVRAEMSNRAAGVNFTPGQPMVDPTVR